MSTLPEGTKALQVSFIMESKTGIQVSETTRYPASGFVPGPDHYRFDFRRFMEKNSAQTWHGGVQLFRMEIEFLK